MADTLGDMIRERAVDRRDGPAITYQDRTITYGELDARSNQVAHALRAAGIVRGDRVAILDKNVPEFFELLLGTVKLGAVLAAVNWRLAPPEIAQILNDSTARVLLVGAEFLPCVEEIESELETVELVITTEAGTSRPGFAEWRDAQPTDDLNVDVSTDDVAVQFYTSGTTGLPKGAMVAHRAMFSLVTAANEALRLSADSVAMVAMPCFHIAGAGWGIICLMDGAHSVLLREVDLVTILRRHPEVRRHARGVRPGGVAASRRSPGRREHRLLEPRHDPLRRVTDLRGHPREVDRGVRLPVPPGVRAHRDRRRGGAVAARGPRRRRSERAPTARRRASRCPGSSSGSSTATARTARSVTSARCGSGRPATWRATGTCRRPPRPRSRPTAGFCRETRATSTPTATSTSTTASRT